MSTNKSWIIPVAVGVVSFGSGLAAGYFLGKRKKDETTGPPEGIEVLEVVMDPEDLIQDKAEWLATKARHPSVPKPVDEIEDVEFEMVDPPLPREPRPNPADIKVDSIVLEGGHALHDDPEINDRLVAEFLKHDRFTSPVTDWDMERELAEREANPGLPYVIHKDEFWGEERGYTQICLGYYDVNDILVDDENIPIYNYKKIIGTLEWGHGSGDPNVFHVRNERLEAEYEITRYKGEEYKPGQFDEPPVRHPRKKIKPPRD